MYVKVSEKNGLSLFKHVKLDKSIIYDSDGNEVFNGTNYQAAQEYLTLTSKKGA